MVADPGRNAIQALDILDSEIDSIKQACEDVQKKYSLARTSSKHLLSQTNDLQSEREHLELQRSLASLFLERFTLKPEEEAIIVSKEPDISTGLFKVMNRLERIRQEARVLLGGSITSSSGAVSSSEPAKANAKGGGGAGIRAGVDVMDTTSRQLDAAYGRIARWLSFEFRQPVREGMEVSNKTKEAIRRVHAGGRADLLEPALATLSAIRASYMSNSFQMALTVGGPPPSNLPRPIELHAHDPLRYVGDMLAWVHQALASEREFLTALFSEHDDEFGGRRIGQRRRGLEGSLDMRASDTASSLAEEVKDGSLKLTAAERATRQMLDKSLDGCCRPLRTRILQTARSQEGCIVTFKLANLIDFYRLTITRTLGSKAALTQTLSETSRATYEAFAVTLDKQASGLSRFNEPPDQTLEIPPPLQGAGTILKELMNVLKSSFVEECEDNALDQQARRDAQQQLELVNEKLVKPMVAMCERLAAQVVAKRPRGKSEQAANWDKSIFLCNCLEHIQSILAPYALDKEQIEVIKAKENEQAQLLVDAHYQNLLSESHLAPLVKVIEKQESGSALAHQPSASPEDVAGTLAKFNEFLASQSVLSSSHLNLLNAPAFRADIQQKALAEVAGAYGKIVRAVEEPSNRYEWRETLIKRSEQEVRLLLGVD